MNRQRAWRLLQIHFAAVAVLGLLAVLLIAGHDADAGACIGCGFPLLGLYALGLPWSVIAWIIKDPGTSDTMAVVLPLVAAVVNLGLHAAYAAHKDP